MVFLARTAEPIIKFATRVEVVYDRIEHLERRKTDKIRRVLFRTGGAGRSIMRRLIRRGRTGSRPGEPPKARQPGGGGMKDVRFAVNMRQQAVIIGHQYYGANRWTRRVRFQLKGGRRARRRGNVVFDQSFYSPSPVPKLLNKGGFGTFTTIFPSGRRKTRISLHRPRPFRHKAYLATIKVFAANIERERL